MTDADDVPEVDTTASTRTADDISAPVEALLLLADEPLSEVSLAAVLDVPVAVVVDCLAALVTFYDETGRGFDLRQLGGGWRYYTRAEHAEIVSGFVLEGQQSKLSQASLETLAVVAYQQPISRARISAVRGVNVDGVIRTLLARGLLEEAGNDVDSGAVVFNTTSYFLERMGLKSLDDLPELAPHLPEVDELEAELGQLALVREQQVQESVGGNDPDEPSQPDDQDLGHDQDKVEVAGEPEQLNEQDHEADHDHGLTSGTDLDQHIERGGDNE